jgi:integrase
VVGPPKSAASCRVVALDAETIRVLTRHRERQEKLSAAAGSRWQDSGYVFTTADGAPMRPDYLTGRFRRLVAASGQPSIRLHDLRHGAATLALAAHTDLKVVQAMLGHASIVLTSDTYVSVLPEVAHCGPTPPRSPDRPSPASAGRPGASIRQPHAGAP